MQTGLGGTPTTTLRGLSSEVVRNPAYNASYALNMPAGTHMLGQTAAGQYTSDTQPAHPCKVKECAHGLCSSWNPSLVSHVLRHLPLDSTCVNQHDLQRIMNPRAFPAARRGIFGSLYLRGKSCRWRVPYIGRLLPAAYVPIITFLVIA